VKNSGFLRNSECEIQSTEVWSGTWMFCENFVVFVAFLLLRDTDAECQSLFVVSTDKFTRVCEFFGFGFVFVVGLFSFDY